MDGHGLEVLVCASGTDILFTVEESFSSSAKILSTEVVKAVSIAIVRMAKRETSRYSTIQCDGGVGHYGQGEGGGVRRGGGEECRGVWSSRTSSHWNYEVCESVNV